MEASARGGGNRLAFLFEMASASKPSSSSPASFPDPQAVEEVQQKPLLCFQQKRKPATSIWQRIQQCKSPSLSKINPLVVESFKPVRSKAMGASRCWDPASLPWPQVERLESWFPERDTPMAGKIMGLFPDSFLPRFELQPQPVHSGANSTKQRRES